MKTTAQHLPEGQPAVSQCVHVVYTLSTSCLIINSRTMNTILLLLCAAVART